jgi:hypothetical protein
VSFACIYIYIYIYMYVCMYIRANQHTYIHAQVDHNVTINWNQKPDEEGLINYLCKEKGFSEKRVRGGIYMYVYRYTCISLSDSMFEQTTEKASSRRYIHVCISLYMYIVI